MFFDNGHKQDQGLDWLPEIVAGGRKELRFGQVRTLGLGLGPSQIFGLLRHPSIQVFVGGGQQPLTHPHHGEAPLAVEEKKAAEPGHDRDGDQGRELELRQDALGDSVERAGVAPVPLLHRRDFASQLIHQSLADAGVDDGQGGGPVAAALQFDRPAQFVEHPVSER